MFIRGASSLSHNFRTLPLASQKRFLQSVITIPGLSLNPNSSYSRKTAQYQLNLIVATRADILTWNDAVNNLMSSHRSNSNNFKTLSDLKIRDILISKKKQTKFFV